MNLNKQYNARNNSYVVNKLKQKQDELLHWCIK